MIITPGYIQVFSGIYFNVFNPDPDDIRLEDIAHALSNLCRFGGHTRQFYSVAQHSVYASYMVPDFKLAIPALLHDATEAYIVDMPRPIKRVLTQYAPMELVLAGHIASAFGYPVDIFEHPIIKTVDDKLCVMEAIELLTNQELVSQWAGGRPDILIRDIDVGFECWTPEIAKKAFLSRFHHLREIMNEYPN